MLLSTFGNASTIKQMSRAKWCLGSYFSMLVSISCYLNIKSRFYFKEVYKIENINCHVSKYYKQHIINSDCSSL